MLPHSTYRVSQLARLYTSVIKSLEFKQQMVHTTAAESNKEYSSLTVSNQTTQYSRYISLDPTKSH